MGNEAENTKGEESELIEYRLSNIEKTLSKLETLLSANQMQDRDIQDLQKKQDMLEGAYNAHDQRLRKLEEAPLKAKADRWTQIIDTFMKLIISGCAVAVLAKVGLQ